MKRVPLTLFRVCARAPIVFVIVLLMVSAFPLAPVQAVQQKPFGAYHIVPESKILYPRLGAPTVVRSGSSFSVYLKSDIRNQSAWGATIQSLFDKYDLSFEKSELDSAASEWKVTFLIPDSAPRGLYSLTVRADKPSLVEYSEPNSIFVAGPSYPSTVKVAVITDTHYGVVSPYYDITTNILRRSIDALNAIGLDLVIGNGDMTDATYDDQAFVAVRAELARLRVPILLVPGNNDHQSVLRGRYLWEQYLAPNSVILDFGRYHFVGLDSQEGSIPNEQLQWTREDLSSTPAGAFKVLVFHHPYWTEAHPSLKVEIPKIITDYGVNLVLNGHWHYDDVQQKPALSIVTTSLSSSDQFVGYRLLNLTSTGVEYTPQSLPYIKLNVVYLQRNDFTSTGGAVLIENGLDRTLDLTLTFQLRNSATPVDKPQVEGGSVIRSTATKMPSGREVVQVLASVGPGQRQLVKTYYETDITPPSITLGTQIDGSTIILKPSASDVGLGLLSLRVFYSTDNTTWVEVIPKLVERSEKWTISTTAPKIYLKAEAVDAAGLKTVKYLVVELLPATSTTTSATTQTVQPPNLSVYLGLLVAILIIPLLIILARRKRVQKHT